MVSVNADGSVNCVSVDTNGGDDITTLLAGIGISITGAGSARTITNTGDTNPLDDITTVSSSGGITVAGAGNSRTIGHSTWACPAGSAIRIIDATGAVTCESTGGGAGDITDVTAGSGLTGGGASGSITLNIGAGIGITVTADAVSLDTTFTDGRYVDDTFDTMTNSGEVITLNADGNSPAIEMRDTDGTGLTPFLDFSNDAGVDFDMRLILLNNDELGVTGGNLNMQNNLVVNRGCPAGYTKFDQLCIQTFDNCCLNFTQAAAACRAADAHLCTSAEMRSAMALGATSPPGGSTYILDWMADQVEDDQALYVSVSNADNPDNERGTSTSSWYRCCISAE
jgi:hypothetical protein